MPVKELPLSDIRVDHGVLPRERTNREMVEHLSEWGRTYILPDAVVFSDGTTSWLADGLHRYEAAKARGDTTLRCDVRSGKRDTAIWYAAGANREHGVPLTNKEKRLAVAHVLSVPTYWSLSDSAIAEQVGCSAATVMRVRQQMTKKNATKTSEGGAKKNQKTVTTKTGRKQQVSTSSRRGAGRPSKQRQAAKTKKTLHDGVQTLIPDWLRATAEEACDFDSFLTDLGKVEQRVVRLRAATHGSGQLLDVDSIAEHIEAIRKLVRAARFFGVCPECRARGKAVASCECNGRGWYNETDYSTKVLS